MTVNCIAYTNLTLEDCGNIVKLGRENNLDLKGHLCGRFHLHLSTKLKGIIMAGKILILAANPKDTTQLRLNEEIREIDNGLQRAQKRDEFTLEAKLAARPQDVRRAMLDFRPNIVHFCGHGEGEEGIIFENNTGDAHLVQAGALAGLFDLFAEKTECVILNACYSDTQAEAIAQHIDFVIGMKREIGDKAAINFAVAFYDGLGAGEPIEFAFKLGCNAIQWAGLPEHLTPVLKKRKKELPNMSQQPNIKEPTILVIGSGTGEKVLHLKAKMKTGSKQTVQERKELYGGSGVNYTFRLGEIGHNVLPILSVGDDWPGQKIQEKIIETFSSEHTSKFVQSNDFFCDKLATTESTVIVWGNVRTIISSELTGFELFGNFVEKRIQQVEKLNQLEIKAVMIGHIYADGDNVKLGQEGEITKKIIDKYADRNIVLFTNFGRSQYRLGHKFWKKTLQKVTIFQLALDEAREFFSQDGSIISLQNMIEWFQDNEITAVITMDEAGAIATLGSKKYGVIFARPYDLGKDDLDTTGAGDAFGAGLVSYFVDKIVKFGEDSRRNNKKDWHQIISIGDFGDAIEQARHWAAYCCTTLGAASDCPDTKELDDFIYSLEEQAPAPVQTVPLRSLDDFLWLIDRVY